MKYTIEGFSQRKLIEFGLDCTDAVIIRWFVDFYHTGKMAKVFHKDREYVWVDYSGILSDLPILNVSKKTIRNRFIKYETCGLMSHFTKKDSEGTYSCYSLNETCYNELVSDRPQGEGGRKSFSNGVRKKAATPYPEDFQPKDSSTNLNSNTKQTNVGSSFCDVDGIRKVLSQLEVSADEIAEIQSIYDQAYLIDKINQFLWISEHKKDKIRVPKAYLLSSISNDWIDSEYRKINKYREELSKSRERKESMERESEFVTAHIEKQDRALIVCKVSRELFDNLPEKEQEKIIMHIEKSADNAINKASLFEMGEEASILAREAAIESYMQEYYKKEVEELAEKRYRNSRRE